MFLDTYYIIRRDVAARIKRKLKKLDSRQEKEVLENRKLGEGNVLFLYETICPSQIYRVQHAASVLESLSLKTRLLSIFELESLKTLHFLQSYSLIILHRIPFNSEIKRLILTAKKHDIPIVLDLDDYIFDPDIYKQSAIFLKLNSLEKKLHIKMSHNIRKTLEHSDAITVSTSYLNSVINKNFSKICVTVPNCISDEMIRVSNQVRQQSLIQNSQQSIAIGYLSGTSTHDKDILVVLPAIEFILNKYSNVEFHLFGPIQLPSKFMNYFKQRIRLSPLVSWKDIHSLYLSIDVNIAPLEQKNPFCKAKSPIKYLEAGLNGVPTIASATEAFSEAIVNGNTGFLAKTIDDWKNTLEYLVTDLEKRSTIGQNARINVLKNHHLSKTIPIWKNFLYRLKIPFSNENSSSYT